MSGAGAIAERIDAAWSGLSPQEQRVADFLRARPAESALYNSSELARLTGVSKATVSRLFRRLGFADSGEARDLLRAQRGAGTPVVLHEGQDRAAAQLAGEVANLRRLHAELDREALAAASSAIALADRVLVIGLRSGFPVAMLLRQALAQVRPDVRLLPEHGQSLGEDLVGLTARDVVVLVSLRRRPAGFARVLAALASSAAPVVLLADPGAACDPRVAHRFTVPIESASAFDSYAAAASLTSVLADAVLLVLGEDGAARVAAVDASYRTLAELDPA